MSEYLEVIANKINKGEEIFTLVRSMKALASTNINQYELAMEALTDYYRTVQLGLSISLRDVHQFNFQDGDFIKSKSVQVLVFGSDQGLVGRFNEVIAEKVLRFFNDFPLDKTKIWAVGDRIAGHLTDRHLNIEGVLELPTSVHGITSLVTEILDTIPLSTIYIFYNQPVMKNFLFQPYQEQLLPLDKEWLENLEKNTWPSNRIPEIMGDREKTLGLLVREYLFVSLYRACASSLTSENTSRLASMQRVEKNIREFLENLQELYYQKRQEVTDNELFDLISGFEALRNDLDKRDLF
ncbi:F0F1 ATP synthase subunit gamma [Echinicola shivajiensis]|uniref:F0F1 ATP synthase subunit gamma n=1 Tax=Echinicola shivajiensis TaxID=1035916 RepID=UPI001BFC0D77|nr:F0F1 ATP synthase subunit gamma [Echinicola shivajiensis]